MMPASGPDNEPGKNQFPSDLNSQGLNQYGPSAESSSLSFEDNPLAKMSGPSIPAGEDISQVESCTLRFLSFTTGSVALALVTLPIIAATHIGAKLVIGGATLGFSTLAATRVLETGGVAAEKGPVLGFMVALGASVGALAAFGFHKGQILSREKPLGVSKPLDRSLISLVSVSHDLAYDAQFLGKKTQSIKSDLISFAKSSLNYVASASSWVANSFVLLAAASTTVELGALSTLGKIAMFSGCALGGALINAGISAFGGFLGSRTQRSNGQTEAS